jgi:hypothetical protein
MAVRAGTAAGIIAAAEANFNEKGPRERAFFYRRHSGAMRSIELWCAIARLRISRFPDAQLRI